MAQRHPAHSQRPMAKFRIIIIACLVVNVVASDIPVASRDTTAPKSESVVVVVVSDETQRTCVDVDVSEDNVNNMDESSDVLPQLVKGLAQLVNETLRESFDNRVSVMVMDATCGETDLIIQQLVRVMASKTIAGVVTLTRRQTVDEFMGLLKHLDIPVVEILSGDVIIRDSSGPSHYVVPHYRYAQIQHALLLAQHFNWTAVSMTSSDQGSVTSRISKDLFKRMAFDHHVCSLPTTLSHGVPRIVFLSSGSFSSSRIPTGSGTTLVVGGTTKLDNVSLPSFDDMKDQILLLNSVDLKWSSFTQAIIELCTAKNILSMDINPTVSGNSPNFLCASMNSLDDLSSDVKSSLEGFVTSMSFLLNMTSTSQDYSSCDGSETTFECLLLGNQLGNLRVDPVSNIMQTPTNMLQIQNLNRDDNEHENFTRVSVDGYWLNLPTEMPPNVFNQDCGDFCDYCASCFPTKVSETKMMSSGEGDAYIIGFFPIHTSTSQESCTQPNPIGYAAATAFLDAVSSYQSQINAWNMTNFRGIVFDSCGSPNEVNRIVNSLETCSHSFRENVHGMQISRCFEKTAIIGYVDGMNNFGTSTFSKDKIVLSIDKSGFSVSKDTARQFIDNSLITLSKIGWTVMNVIVSNDEPFIKMSQMLKDSPLSNSFCFLSEVVIRSDPTYRTSDLDLAMATMDKSPVYFLLTNHEDTGGIVQHIKASSTDQNTKVSFVFTPWNQQWYDTNEVKAVSEVNIIFKSSIKSTSQQILDAVGNMMTSASTPWSKDFTDVADIYDVLADGRNDLILVLQAIDEFLDALVTTDPARLAMLASLPEVSYTALDVSAVYVSRGALESTIARVDTYLTQQTPFAGPTHYVCEGWCPACHACKTIDRAQHTNFYQDGDLIISGIFPLHSGGPEAFSCGNVQNDDHHLLHVQAFIFAIETAKLRYHDLLPGLTVGGLVLDSCSSSLTALKVLGDFETCASNFGGSLPVSDSTNQPGSSDDSLNLANPTKNVAYVIDSSYGNTDILQNVMRNSKYGNAAFVNRNAPASLDGHNDAQLGSAIVKILIEMGWNKVIVITESLPLYKRKHDAFLIEAQKSNLCVLATLEFEITDEWRVARSLAKYKDLPVVLLSSQNTLRILFDWMKTGTEALFWIIPVTHYDELEKFPNIPAYFPLGSIVIDAKSKQNDQFSMSIRNSTTDSTVVSSMSPWFRDLWRLRFSCFYSSDVYRDAKSLTQCPATAPNSDTQNIPSAAYEVIESVDAILHGIHEEYVAKCPEKKGICDNFANDLLYSQLSFVRDVSFSYQGEQLEYNTEGEFIPTLSVFNVQRDATVKVGSFFKFSLSLDTASVRLYTTSGLELTQVSKGECTEDCPCLDIAAGIPAPLRELKDYQYFAAQAEFLGELWAIIIVAIAGCGAFMCVMFAIYVVYKVCKRTLGRRYVGLGLSLLCSLILLYLTVLPFVFKPSEAVCGLRFFLSGVSYAVCFAVILVKLMSLQNYKVIGLGGEVPGVNQFLTVFFIVGVQVAVGVQWWVDVSPTMYSKEDENGVLLYACKFDLQDFALYHVYVLFLIIMCSFYAIFVRKEKKNMGEAKLLLASSWTCVFIWAAWLLCFFLLDRKWSDLIVCAAILACATVITFIVFVPKIRMVARLKYDLSHKVNFRNGYSVDTDFLYERPYSLPGTLTSTFSSAKMNYPKTYSNFDSDVNY